MPKTLTVIVQRQLQAMTSGNDAYLQTFMRVARRANLKTKVIFAPWRTFANRPWAKFHPAYQAVFDEAVWPKSIRIGDYFLSYSIRVWWRFAVRIVQEVLRRIGFDVFIASYYARPMPDEEYRIVVNTCHNHPCDIMMAEYSALAPIFDEVTDPKVKSVLVHDLMAARTQEYERLNKVPDFLPVTLDEEAAWMANANLLICASGNEQATLKTVLPETDSVWLCPDSPVHNVALKNETPRIVFVGTRHFGNTDAINHFIEGVFPLIREKLPDVECWVVGSTGTDVTPDNQSVEGVKLLGRVETLADIGGVASVGIAPTRMASGISIKVAEYLALGMTCVAYRKALEGFGDALDHLTEIAEDAQDFADRTVALIKDEAARTAHFKIAPDAMHAISHNKPVEDALLKPFKTADI